MRPGYVLMNHLRTNGVSINRANDLEPLGADAEPYLTEWIEDAADALAQAIIGSIAVIDVEAIVIDAIFPPLRAPTAGYHHKELLCVAGAGRTGRARNRDGHDWPASSCDRRGDSAAVRYVCTGQWRAKGAFGHRKDMAEASGFLKRPATGCMSPRAHRFRHLQPDFC